MELTLFAWFRKAPVRSITPLWRDLAFREKAIANCLKSFLSTHQAVDDAERCAGQAKRNHDAYSYFIGVKAILRHACLFSHSLKEYATRGRKIKGRHLRSLWNR